MVKWLGPGSRTLSKKEAKYLRKSSKLRNKQYRQGYLSQKERTKVEEYERAQLAESNRIRHEHNNKIRQANGLPPNEFKPIHYISPDWDNYPQEP